MTTKPITIRSGMRNKEVLLAGTRATNPQMGYLPTDSILVAHRRAPISPSAG